VLLTLIPVFSATCKNDCKAYRTWCAIGGGADHRYYDSNVALEAWMEIPDGGDPAQNATVAYDLYTSCAEDCNLLNERPDTGAPTGSIYGSSSGVFKTVCTPQG
jgi:hypothetical protein